MVGQAPTMSHPSSPPSSHPSVLSGVRHVIRPPRRPGPGQFWWDALPDDFHEHPERFEMGRADRVRVLATAAVDRVVNAAASTLLSAAVLPFGYRPSEVRAWFEERDLYEDAARGGDPQRFFAPPPAVEVTHQPGRGAFFKPRDGVCESLTFASPYTPHNPRLASGWFASRRNRVAHALYWRHQDGPRPTIIGLHGFAADPFLLNQLFFAMPWFYDIGCDVVLFTMPFHGRRQPRRSLFTGQHFFTGGPAHVNEAFGQTVCDLRALIAHLVDRVGVPRLGITGMSLGGNVAALMAAVEPALQFSIPNAPVVSLGDLLLEWHPIAELIQLKVGSLGLSPSDLRRAFAVASPLSYRPVLPRDNLMIIAGAADRMASPKQARMLWDHWKRPDLYWFPGNHVIHLDRGSYLRQMARLMNRIGFLEDSRLSAAAA